MIVIISTTAPLTAALGAQNITAVMREEDFFLFPYHFCAVLTVKDCHTEAQPHWSPRDQTTILSVHIDDVLRGELPQGADLDLTFAEPTEALFGGQGVAELRGRRLVLAFESGRFPRPVRNTLTSPWLPFEIRKLYAPFPQQRFTDKDLETLKQNLTRYFYPLRACLELVIEDIKEGKSGFQSDLDARIVKVLLDHQMYPAESPAIFGERTIEPKDAPDFKKDGLVRLRTSGNELDQLFPNKSRSELIGTKCVLSFTVRPSQETYDLNNQKVTCDPQSRRRIYDIAMVTVPFPGQVYTDLDIQKLASRLQYNSARLESSKSVMRSYIEERLSKERIQMFCQPQTRSLTFHAGPQQWASEQHPTWDLIVVTDRLYPEAEDQLGKIEWFYDFIGGFPSTCWVRIERKNLDVWMIEYPVVLGKQTDDDFTKFFLYEKLLNYWQSYRKVHSLRTFEEPGSGPILQISKIVRNKEGRIVGFEGWLAVGMGAGQPISGNLDNKLDPSSILFEGKPCPFWDRVCAEASQNIDKIVNDLRHAP